MTERFRAVVFYPGPRTRWKTAANFKTGTFTGELEPAEEEIILDRTFRIRFLAECWARAHLKRLKNVCAGLYVTTVDQ